MTALAYAPRRDAARLAAGGVRALEPAAGRERALLEAPVRALAVSAAAPRAVLALGPDGTVRQVSTDGRARRVIANVPGATAIAWSPDARTCSWPRPRRPLAPDRRRHQPRRVLQHVAGRLDPDGLGRAAVPGRRRLR